MKIVRRGALPLGGDGGIEKVARPRARGRVPDARRRPGSAAQRDVLQGFAERCLSIVDVERDRAAEGRARRRQRHGRDDDGADPRPPAARRRALPLRPGRHVPALPAEPAAGGEPPVHHRRGQAHRRRPRHRLGRRRRPLLLHRRHRRVRRRATSSPRSWPSRCSRSSPGETILYDLRASRAVPDIVERGRRHGDREPRRPRLHQAPHAQGERALRRRGLRALLLPRLLRRRHGHRARARRARAGLERRARSSPSCSRRCTSATTSRARSTRPSSDVPLKLQELKERYGPRGEGGRVDAPRRRLGRLRRLALQRAARRTPSRSCGSTSRPTRAAEMERRRDEVLALIRS